MLPSADLYGVPDELANRMMMVHGSGELLRALRGEPLEAPPEAPARRYRPYVAVAARPKFGAPEAVRNIMTAVADAFGVPCECLNSTDRRREVVLARSVAIRLIRDRTWDDGEPRHSTTTIGRYMGRDHSTVCYSLDRFPDYCRSFPEVAEVYEALREMPA